ncbi:MAG: dTMP kinase [Thermoplasmatota archaeon]
MPAPRLIVCEGIDGSGKTTVSKALASALGARWTAEPTDTWLGEAVRRAVKDPDASPWTEAFLFMADHAAHVERVRGWLEAGQSVVSDRWCESTFAYQGAALAAPDFDAVVELRKIEARFDRAPDVVLLFDLPVEVALARVGARGREAEKFERAAFLETVRANYLRLAREAPGGRWRVIDASEPQHDVLGHALAALG